MAPEGPGCAEASVFGPPLLQGILWTPLEYLGLLTGVFLGGWFLSGDSGLLWNSAGERNYSCSLHPILSRPQL